jgi:hypothetical protein
MTEPTAFGLIPQSSALAEASPESINELLAADPEQEGFGERLRKIIGLLRAQRERYMKAETLKRDAPRKRASPAIAPSKLLEARPAEATLEDLL